jgi:hypothetical protein
MPRFFQSTYFDNFSLKLESGVLGIVDAQGRDFLEINPAIITMPVGDGTFSIRQISSSFFLDESDLDGALFGTTAGVAETEDILFFGYPVFNDIGTIVRFFISRLTDSRTSPVVGKIGQASSIGGASDIDSFYSISSLTASAYAERPCFPAFRFRMRKNSSDEWTIQTLDGRDGFVPQYLSPTLAEGDIIYRTKAGDTRLPRGSDGDKLMMSSGLPAWTADESSYELISSATASTTATIEFTNLTSDFYAYRVLITDLVPSSSVAFILRTSSNNGSSYDDTSGDYGYAGIGRTFGGNSRTSQSTGAIAIVLTPSGSPGSGTGANHQAQYDVLIYNPSSTKYTNVDFSSNIVLSDGDTVTLKGTGTRFEAAIVNAIQFRFNGANMMTGEFKLYGIRAN